MAGNVQVSGGSSPLARGLHKIEAALKAADRIIPARAGFTPHGRPSARTTSDHPRSRGVYHRFPGVEVCKDGSSPLARGLRWGLPGHSLQGGIIPARAGFTHPGHHKPREDRDHPRSRGVYLAGVHHVHERPGSSPLARGLRDLAEVHLVAEGIIPARAGFTSATPFPRRPPGDHPRSRGVYAGQDVTVGEERGSSPLARGLRRPTPAGSATPWIIPARAGFTGGAHRPRLGRGDHPRSRGVYRPLLSSATVGRGSSPLARGLLILSAARGTAVGIIPARAGFTSSARRTPRHSPDHPRSRGVYGAVPVELGATEGSSPLARGLQRSPDDREGRVGIIPARAGFTAWKYPIVSQGSDHPRSRGVYAEYIVGDVWREGSSPLARGLPAQEP